MKVLRVAKWSAHDLGDDQRRIGLGHGLYEVAPAARRNIVEQLLEEPPHRRPVAVDRPWRERRVDQVSQAAVVSVPLRVAESRSRSSEMPAPGRTSMVLPYPS